ncbi:threonine synthase [Arthrobacter pigmenti]
MAEDSRYPHSLWRFKERMPVSRSAEPVTLGEGMTPLHRCESLDHLLPRGGRIWLKDETCNPTGSFKDRLVTVAITRAQEVGTQIVTCASSGNAAASTAAYAARAGMAAIVFVPESTPLAKVRQARAYGAQVAYVPGDYSNSYQVCDAIARRFGWPNLTTTYLNPYGTAGLATVGYELVEQLAQAGVQSPALIAGPVGSGPLIYGVSRGYREAGQASEGQQVPLLAVQSSGCAPISRAFEAGDSRVEPWTTPTTYCSGISDPLRGYPGDGTATLNLVRASGGSAIEVDDLEIAQAAQWLARHAGVLAEPTGAAALAGVKAYGDAGKLPANSDVVVLITGHGFKQPDHMPGADEEPVTVDAGMTTSAGLTDLYGQTSAEDADALDALGAKLSTTVRGA